MKSARLVISVPEHRLIEELGEFLPDVDIIEWNLLGPPPVEIIDLVVVPYMSPPKLLLHLAGVRTRVVQSQSVGFDGVKEVLPPGHVFSNAASVHETSTSELAVTLILASQRGIPDFVRAAGMGRWAPMWHESLADRSVLLVGYGGVGKAIEDRLLPFETKVTRVASTARSDARGKIYSIQSLPELLPSSEIVIVGVPLTKETTHLIDDSFLSLMRDGSLLVNIARGSVADTEALLVHAMSGRLRLALDVTDPEPLPFGHPLFSLPNVLISPHVGGASTAMLPRMARLIRVQVSRMLDGKTPVNVVLQS
jgi:phosphoglycerate dehydrogenase-like enzyme